MLFLSTVSCKDEVSPGPEPDPEPVIPENALNLSAKEGANCYIVPLSTYAFFNAEHKGNSNTEKIEGYAVSAKLLWQDTPATITKVEYIPSSKNVVVTTGETPGNGVVAVLDIADNVLWSWHLWVTDYDPDATAYTTQPNASGTTWTFMDRNLGATTADHEGFGSHGLIYQWGRKDPFAAPAGYTEIDESYQYVDGKDGEATLYDIDGKEIPSFGSRAAFHGTKELSFNNPMVFYAMTYWHTGEYDEYGDEIVENDPRTGDWTAFSDDDFWGGESMKKTIYDPCPPGWKVPVSDEDGNTPYAWLVYANMTWDSVNKGAEQDGQWFPATGTRVYASGGCDFSEANPYSGIWFGTKGKAAADLEAYPTLYGQYMFIINGKRTFKVNKDKRSQGMSVRAVKDI